MIQIDDVVLVMSVIIYIQFDGYQHLYHRFVAGSNLDEDKLFLF
jgi:hypothetical protein